MKRLSILFFINFISIYVFSQKDITNKIDNNFGSNKKHFAYSYIGIGFMTPPTEDEGANIIYGKSHTFTYGIKYKYKIANVFSIGLGINYNYQTWHLKQDESKLIPDNILYDKEKISTNNIASEVFFRFNFGKRDNSIGNYIDIAPYGEWVYKSERELTLSSANSNLTIGEEYNVITNVHLNYVNRYNYGLKLRFGLGRLSIFGKYRMSDFFTQDFKSSLSNTELDRLVVGIEIGLHE